MSIIEKNTIEGLQGTWFFLLVKMVLAYNLSKSFAERIKLYLLMAKDKQKDLFITKAKHLNTCELKTWDKKKI